METIRNVLVLDSSGKPTQRHRLVESDDWDQIRSWSDKVYMPYYVSPIGRQIKPLSILDAAKIGHFTLSRFKYGIPVNIKDFSPEAGTGMVLTTVEGSARHWSEPNAFADTGVGDSFVVDNSRTHYWVDFAPKHLQVNLTFSHDELSALHERWFGCKADERLWTIKFKFGGPNSSWITLLSYVCQCITEMPEAIDTTPLGKHFEELIGIHLLTEWRRQLDRPFQATAHRMAPRHVMLAEKYIEDHARLSPTLSELAMAVGVSVRTLGQAFREYRGVTPMEALREKRLQGVRTELLLAHPGVTVQSVAEAWGFVNMGMFAGLYRRRFNEMPSETLKKRR